MGKRKRETDLVRYLSHQDIDLVLERIPNRYTERLREVFIHYRSRGVRVLGSVRSKGRRDINLTTVLPPRVSLGRYLDPGVSAEEFGAPPRGQWPPWAVRRFLLYDVFLHELGHLQLVRPEGRGMNRKYASESLAKEFACEMRALLWSEMFKHPDPIHNPPQEDELETILLWKRLGKEKRYDLVSLVLEAPHPRGVDLSPFGIITAKQRTFLRRALRQRPQAKTFRRGDTRPP